MVKQITTIALIVSISLTVYAVQKPSYRPRKLPPFKPGMTAEERKKEVEKSIEQQRQQRREQNKEYMNFLARQAWKHLLKVNDQQLKLIEPKFEKVRDLGYQSHVRAGSGIRRDQTRDEQYFHWNRPSESNYGPMEGKAREQMPEGYRIIEELIDLLENEKSKDEEIRLQVDALQQAREKARKALPQAKRELAAVLTTPRQEAVFLIQGCID